MRKKSSSKIRLNLSVLLSESESKAYIIAMSLYVIVLFAVMLFSAFIPSWLMFLIIFVSFSLMFTFMLILLFRHRNEILIEEKP